MKIKEILLDFTPLLDITLILLFFFLMFSRFEINEIQTELSAKQELLDSQIAEVEIQKEEVNELKRQYEENLEIVEQHGERYSSNLQAILDFNGGHTLKLILNVENNEAILSIYQGDTLLDTAQIDENVSTTISNTFAVAGFDKMDTILCEFILDGSQPGTASAYRMIISALSTVRQSYNFFYYSETDISIVKG